MEYLKVLSKYYGDKKWSFKDTYETLIWLDETIEKPTDEELVSKWEETHKDLVMEQIREERDKLLTETDKYFVSDWVNDKQETYKVYRQELRDLTQLYLEKMTEPYEYNDKVLTKDGVEYNFFPSNI